MSEHDIVIYICRNSLTAGMTISGLTRRVGEAAPDMRVVVREVPCSGKTDVIYLLKAFEGGARGVVIVTCPLGECRLAEGNYRAQVRVRTLGRLLDEIGLGSERLLLLHGAPGSKGSDLPALIEDAVRRLGALPPSRVAVPAETASSTRTEAK